MLKEQLEQIKKTGLYQYSDNPVVLVLQSDPFIAVAAIVMIIALLTLSLAPNKLMSRVTMVAGFLLCIGVLPAILISTPNEDFHRAQHQVVNSVMDEKYNYASVGKLNPDEWKSETVIIVQNASGQRRVHPEIDKNGELKLWATDGTPIAQAQN